MLQRFSWPGATRAQQISALLAVATLISLGVIYFVYYGYCFLAVHGVVPYFLPFDITVAAPSGDGSVDPTDIYYHYQLLWANFGGWIHDFLNHFIVDTLATVLFFLPALLAYSSLGAGVVDMARQRRWQWLILTGVLLLVVCCDFVITNAIVTHVRFISADFTSWTSLIALHLAVYLPWFAVVIYLLAHRYGKTVATQVAVLVPLAFTLTTASVIARGTSGGIMWVYGNECATPANCVESVPSAGFPLPFIFQNPIVSATDAFALPLYLLDVFVFAGFLWLALYLFQWLRQRRSEAKALPEPASI